MSEVNIDAGRLPSEPRDVGEYLVTFCQHVGFRRFPLVVFDSLMVEQRLASASFLLAH